METIKRAKNGNIIGGGIFKDGVIYKGNYEEFQNFIENIEEDMEGMTHHSEDREIPFGDGKLFDIYNECGECEEFEEEQITIWYDTDIKDGEVIYCFGSFNS